VTHDHRWTLVSNQSRTCTCSHRTYWRLLLCTSHSCCHRLHTHTHNTFTTM